MIWFARRTFELLFREALMPPAAPDVAILRQVAIEIRADELLQADEASMRDSLWIVPEADAVEVEDAARAVIKVLPELGCIAWRVRISMERLRK